jgi:hypothetical protein
MHFVHLLEGEPQAGAALDPAPIGSFARIIRESFHDHGSGLRWQLIGCSLCIRGERRREATEGGCQDDRCDEISVQFHIELLLN